MLEKGKYILLFSILLFITDLFTLGNTNSPQSAALQIIGKVIAVVSLILFLVGIILTIVNLIKKTAQKPPKPPAPVKNKGKKFIGLFILVWLLVIFPAFGMSKMGILSKMLEGTGGSIVGQLLFIVLATVATIYPGLYFFPLIFLPTVLLLPLTIYFLFSKSWHKWLDVLLIAIISILMFLQIKALFSI